jgi:ribosome-associated heat shock protein Hsp15
MGIRVDKWLQVARIFKTRTKAANACRAGLVKVNGQPAKPHRTLSVEDRIEFSQRQWKRILIVKELRDRPLPKAEAETLYQDMSRPLPKRDRLEGLLQKPPMLREKGKGRPTKRERRQIERLEHD